MAKKILFVIEGERTETRMLISIFERALKLSKDEFEIFKYKTNIHILFNNMRSNGYDSFLSYLYSIDKKIFPKDMFTPETAFASVYLFFDLDPQDNMFSIKETEEIVTYFSDETINGKAYISYPMVESIFDFCSYKATDFCKKTYPINQLAESYKRNARVNSFLAKKYDNIAFRKILTDDIYSICILNMKKYCYLCNESFNEQWKFPSSPLKVFISELPFINDGVVSVLCCGILLIPDYSSELLKYIKKSEN